MIEKLDRRVYKLKFLKLEPLLLDEKMDSVVDVH